MSEAVFGGEENSGLDRIEHVVVLMLENRSFDHMLGYLSLEGGRDEVDGLRPGMANDHDGRRYPIHHLAATYFPDERWDPEHTAAATDRQINGGAMDGFPRATRTRWQAGALTMEIPA